VREKKSDRDDDRRVYALSGGVVQIDPSYVRILVDEAEHSDELVAAEIEKALEHAKNLRTNAKDAVSISEAEALMNRAATRLKVANLRRHRH
jgi:F-type H+-transporting ATPase subunit epsilon